MNTGSVLAEFNVTLSKAVAEPVSVDWYTSDGTAKATVDYQPNKGTVQFAPGETSKKVQILVYGRAVGTEDRSFYVEMLPPVNAILGATIGECLIHIDTSGSQPVTQIIVPSGDKGDQGDSAYETWLQLPGNAGKTEQEFIDSLKPDPAEIAQEVSPLIDVGNTTLTAQGTDTLGQPDATTVKAIARRVPYAGPAGIATVVLADGDNTISTGNLTGDAVNFQSSGFMPLVLHSGAHYEPDWTLNANGTITIKNVVAGDVLYAIEYRMVSSKNPLARRKEVQEIQAEFDRLQSPAKGDGDELITVISPLAGAIRRTQHDKNGDALSVLDFGAHWDGKLHPLSERFSTLDMAKAFYPFVTSLEQSTDYVAMQAAMDTGRPFTVPLPESGKIGYVNASCVVNNSFKIVGHANTQINRSQSFISVVGNIPLFTLAQGSSQTGTKMVQVFIEGLYIFYDNGVTPTTPAGNSGKVAFNFYSNEPGTTGLEMSLIKDCTVHGGWGCYKDTTGTYLTKLQNVWSRQCHDGFIKATGTTMLLESCYTEGNVSPYQFGAVMGVTMLNCAMDQSSISLVKGSYGGAGVHFVNTHAVNIMGFDVEGNIVSTDGGGDATLIHFENSNGKVSGLTANQNQLKTVAPTASGIVSFIKASGNSQVIIDSSEDEYTGNGLAYTGSGYPATLYAKDNARIDVFSGIYREPQGGTPVLSVVSQGNVNWWCPPLSGLVSGGYRQSVSKDGLQTNAFYTAKGTQAVAANTPTTLFELPNSPGMYLLSVWAAGSGTNYSSTQLIIFDGVPVLTPIKSGAFVTFTVTGRIVTLTSQGATTFNWTYTKLG